MKSPTTGCLALILLAASLALGPPALGAQSPEELRDPAAYLVSQDPEGRKWLATKEALRADSLSTQERMRMLLPWAERYHVSVPGPPSSEAVSQVREAVDDAVRRSVAAKAWRPMGGLSSWESFLAEQGFRPVEERPSLYIVGARQRLYRRAPKLPQAIHTCVLTTRRDRPGEVFSLTMRYSYPPELARKIEELEAGPKDYRRALELRLPAFEADRPLLAALGRQALGGLWARYGERWAELIDYLAEPSHVASRARVLEKKNPPTVSEVRLFGELAAHLYEIGPSGRLEVTPKANAMDLRGNPLYGARRTER